MQGSNTHLNHVLTTLGNLYYIYSNPDVDVKVQNKVLVSLKKHWAAADQDPFIAAVVLNPFLHGRCKGNLMIEHNTQILARGIQSILDKYNTAEGCIPCKGDPKRKL